MQEVKVEREKYIGGSDIPTIMGINPFKKRFDLLLEKACLIYSEFDGNEYTEYGNILEPQIRDYINAKYGVEFREDKLINGDVRCHVDGYDGSSILEIKTTSQVHGDVNDYKAYLSQLLFYMQEYGCKIGYLAVYERPKDFNTTFDETRLKLYEIDITKYEDFVKEIYEAVDRFRIDLVKVKENPFITEEELQPTELIELSNKVVALENKLAVYKELENEYKELKQNLFNEMENANVKSWKTNGGYTITRVDGTSKTTETKEEFDLKTFANDHPELYKQYLKTKTTIKNGKAGFVKITAPKN